jgi:hypothetical protein
LCHTEEGRFRATGMTVHLPKEMIQEDGPREYHHGRGLTCNEGAHRRPPESLQKFLAGLLLPGQRCTQEETGLLDSVFYLLPM